jgi:hypothetical protein
MVIWLYTHNKYRERGLYVIYTYLAHIYAVLTLRASCATALGDLPPSMASANSLKALATMVDSTVFTRETFWELPTAYICIIERVNDRK